MYVFYAQAIQSVQTKRTKTARTTQHAHTPIAIKTKTFKNPFTLK